MANWRSMRYNFDRFVLTYRDADTGRRTWEGFDTEEAAKHWAEENREEAAGSFRLIMVSSCEILRPDE